jgi:hypothetical protein
MEECIKPEEDEKKEKPLTPAEKSEVRREIEKLIKENNRDRENVLRQVRLTNEYK